MKNLFQLQRFPPAIQLLFLLLLFFVGAMLQSLCLTALGFTDLKSSSSNQVLILMVSTQVFSFILPAIGFICLLPKPIPSFLMMKKMEPGTDVFKIVFLTIATLATVLGVSQIMLQLPLGRLADQMQAERKAMESTVLSMSHWQQLPVRVLVMAVLPAIGEELFFRGVLQKFMYTFLKRPILAILATSLIFSLFHGSVYNIIPITIAGFILGAVYFYSGNIWYSILLHFLVNGTQVVISYFQDSSVEEENLSILYAILIAIGGMLSIFAILNSIKKGKVSNKADWTLPYEPMFK